MTRWWVFQPAGAGAGGQSDSGAVDELRQRGAGGGLDWAGIYVQQYGGGTDCDLRGDGDGRLRGEHDLRGDAGAGGELQRERGVLAYGCRGADGTLTFVTNVSGATYSVTLSGTGTAAGLPKLRPLMPGLPGMLTFPGAPADVGLAGEGIAVGSTATVATPIAAPVESEEGPR